MGNDVDVRISPEPPDEHRDAILAAVRELLERESSLARPSPWRVSGWIAHRTGITDLGRFMPAHRRWPASARMPWGGREFVGLNGRGDAK
jgi:hypothetical protein